MGVHSRSARFWLLVIIISACCSFCGIPVASGQQMMFQRTYGGSSDDHGYSIVGMADGGYVVVGITESFGAGLSDMYLVRTDSLGNPVLERTYGGVSPDSAFSVLQTSEGGLVIAGCTGSFGAGLLDAYLVRADSAGDVLWEQTCGGSLDDAARGVQQTMDGGYVVVGYTASSGAGYHDVYLVKTDSVGSLLWEKTYGGASNDEGYSVQQTGDGGYIIVGFTASFAFGPPDAYLIRTDSLGDTLWTRRFGTSLADTGYSVAENSSGEFLITGRITPSFGLCLIKIDTFGNTIWSRGYGRHPSDGGRCVRQTADGGYVVGGSGGGSDAYVYVLRADSLGDSLWTARHPGKGLAWGRSVEQTFDGGYVLVGLTRMEYVGDYDVYVVKTDSAGNSPQRNGRVISIDAPPGRVFVDSTYSVMATVENVGDNVETFYVTATVDGYADTAQVVDLAPGSTAQAAFTDWQVPSVDSVLYTLTVCTHVAGDMDPRNDCVDQYIFAYNPVGVEEGPSRPSVPDFRIMQNSPNPFHHSTLISYSLPSVSQVTLSVYDITGRLVETLVNETQQPGIHQVRWNGKDNPSGVYFYRLKACPEQSPEHGEGRSRRAEEFVETRKMVVVE